MFSLGAVLMLCGKLFQSEGEEYENERWPYDFVGVVYGTS